MGADYSYVNRDRLQGFLCGLSGGSSRFAGIGQGPGARALALLLSERGAWRNERVSVVSDTSCEWEELRPRLVDVEVEVELLLLDVDGVHWLEERLDRPGGFRRACELAVHLRRPDVLGLLDRKFGAKTWRRQYENGLKGTTVVWAQKVVDAGLRGLSLYSPPS